MLDARQQSTSKRAKHRASPGAVQRILDAAMRYAGEGCFQFPFQSGNSDGYVVVRAGQKFTHAHAIICERAHGPRPSPKHQARHLCGEGHNRCIRPSHLAWGLPIENGADRRRAGRQVRRLTPGDVIRIRDLAATDSYRDIADRFGIRGCTVSKIVRRVTWKSIP